MEQLFLQEDSQRSSISGLFLLKTCEITVYTRRRSGISSHHADRAVLCSKPKNNIRKPLESQSNLGWKRPGGHLVSK